MQPLRQPIDNQYVTHIYIHIPYSPIGAQPESTRSPLGSYTSPGCLYEFYWKINRKSSRIPYASHWQPFFLGGGIIILKESRIPPPPAHTHPTGVPLASHWHTPCIPIIISLRIQYASYRMPILIPYDPILNPQASYGSP